VNVVIFSIEFLEGTSPFGAGRLKDFLKASKDIFGDDLATVFSH
jgi:hypothetical protein